MATRNIAFFSMIVIGLIRIASHDGASASDVAFFDISELPNLFGTAVYAFMCHHSLPSIVTPIRNKSILTLLFAGDYSAIFSSYLAVCLTALFAYGSVQSSSCDDGPCELQPLYTLNFAYLPQKWLSGYLTLFPVFTLTSNFPLIAITLRNNIKTLYESIFPPDNTQRVVLNDDQHPSTTNEAAPHVESRLHRIKQWLRFHMFTILTILPPYGIAAATRSVDQLVSFTGAFAGMFIQFVIPAALVFYARKDPRLPGAGGHPATPINVSLQREDPESALSSAIADPASGPLDQEPDESDARSPLLDVANSATGYDNPHSSPFRHRFWLCLIAVWSCATFVMTVYNQIQKFA